jgi:transcriptional regulator with XRE-family HTH domain
MNIEIANRLVQLRKKHNLSQEQLAEKVGVSRQAVSKWERAEASPDTDNLIILSKLYGLSLDAMLFSKDEPDLPVRAAEANVSEPLWQEGYSQDQGSETDCGGGGSSTNNAWEGNGPGWQENGAGWQCNNNGGQGNAAEWQENGGNPRFHRNWGTAERKRISKLMKAFPYPIFLTMLYMVLGFALGLWHPGWMIFLTVPMYYMLADAIGKA